jgi:hypothetical protein
MDQPVQHREGQFIDIDEKRIVEIIVHISEDLDENGRDALVSTLKESSGITNAEFCPLRYHLMLVRYDRGVYTSQDVLRDVNTQNLNARLIGPV